MTEQILDGAARLKALLTEVRVTHPDLPELLEVFSGKMLRELADQLYFYAGPHAYAPRESDNLSECAALRAQTPDEIEAAEREWERGPAAAGESWCTAAD